MDEQTEGQAEDNCDFAEPYVGRVDPIIKVTLSFPAFISKHQKPVYSIYFFMRYTANFRFLQPEWAHPF